MTPLTNTPWKAEPDDYFLLDSKGGAIAHLTAINFSDEERSTIMRAVSQLPSIFIILEGLCSDENGECNYVEQQVMAKQLLAYIAPIEHKAEVLTVRLIHALGVGNDMQHLTYAIRQHCGENLNQYPQHVQDAFANALSLLNQVKQVRHE